MKMKKFISVEQTGTVDITAEDAIKVLAFKFGVPNPVVHDHDSCFCLKGGPDEKDYRFKNMPRGIYLLTDVSHHGSPVWEKKLITVDEDKVQAFEMLQNLARKAGASA